MANSKWSQYNDDILKYWKDSSDPTSVKCAKHILNRDAKDEDVDLFRTYIKRFIKRMKRDMPDTYHSIVDETLHRGNLKEDTWKVAWVKDPETGVSALVSNPDFKNDPVDYEVIRREMIDEMKKLSPKVGVYARKPVSDAHCLVLDIADIHFGKLATPDGSGTSYSTDIAVERVLAGAEGLIDRSYGYNIDRIFFVIGNDVLHTDTPTRTTTAGTPQDTDGMWYDNFKVARTVYASIIGKLSTIAPVHVVHCPSNHDYMSGFMLADAVYCYFHNNKNVTFDVSNKHRKYVKYGYNMLSFSHGDGAKLDQIPYLAAHEAPKIWAETKYRYGYLHHIHSKDYWKFRSGKDFIGMTVEYLRSPSESDRWHETQGYVGAKVAIEAFIHHPEYGQISRLTYNF